jgi:hypothetical protein
VFNKLGARVTYDVSDLESWKAERKRRNTAGTSPLRKSADPASANVAA